MRIEAIMNYLMRDHGPLPSIPRELVPDNLFCEDLENLVCDAIDEARQVIRQRDGLMTLMLEKRFRLHDECQEVIRGVAARLDADLRGDGGCC